MEEYKLSIANIIFDSVQNRLQKIIDYVDCNALKGILWEVD